MEENLQDMIVRFRELKENPISYMRPVVLVLAGELRHRIHVEGLKADGSRIGTYKNPYLEFRQKKHNRTSDTKMIWSLTRQMEQDTVPIADGDTYGIGFNNKHNFDKATWLEEGNKGVYDLSQDEITLAEDVITDYINGIFG